MQKLFSRPQEEIVKDPIFTILVAHDLLESVRSVPPVGNPIYSPKKKNPHQSVPPVSNPIYSPKKKKSAPIRSIPSNPRSNPTNKGTFFYILTLFLQLVYSLTA